MYHLECTIFLYTTYFLCFYDSVIHLKRKSLIEYLNVNICNINRHNMKM